MGALTFSVQTVYEVKIYKDGQIVEDITLPLWDLIDHRVRASISEAPASNMAALLPAALIPAETRAEATGTPPPPTARYESLSEKAWKLIGRPATAAAIYEKMLEIGYQNRSANAIRSVREGIRLNKAFIKVYQEPGARRIGH